MCQLILTLTVDAIKRNANVARVEMAFINIAVQVLVSKPPGFISFVLHQRRWIPHERPRKTRQRGIPSFFASATLCSTIQPYLAKEN